jgi:uncharacterized protein (DUF1800 family)
VTSNPSPAYVARVAAVFNNDGKGVKGNLAAVACRTAGSRRRTPRYINASYGKLREPMLRMVAWARAYRATSAGDNWAIGNTSDASARWAKPAALALGVQSPARLCAAQWRVAAAGLVAPEFQLTNESSVVGYVNYMQRAVSKGIADVKADYSSLLPLAGDAKALLGEINLVLAAGS